MKARFALFLAVLLLVLAGCGGQVPSETVPETVATLQTTVPETTAAPESEEPQFSSPAPGYYLVSSVGKDEGVTFYNSLDPENGYIKLEADGTGRMCFEGTEGPLTWDAEAIYWQEQTLPCVYITYYDSELGRDDSILAVYFLDPVVSLALRLAEEPGAGEAL